MGDSEMVDEDSKHEIEKLQEDIKVYLTQVALTNPKQLPAAMLEVMRLMMRFEMQHSITEFLKALMDKLDEQNKGR